MRETAFRISRSIGEILKKFLLKFWRILVTLFVIVPLLALFLFGGSVYYVFFYGKTLPDVRTLREYRPNSVTTVYDRAGKKIAEWYRERRMPVGFEEIPEILVQAIISAEDKNFFSHGGIDWTSIARAAYKNVEYALTGQKRIQGGSTITQQLVGNIFLDRRERTIERKIHEMRLAYDAEKLFTKKEIFTLYANHVYLGDGQYGFAAAADYYFGKDLRDLTVYEAATLAGLIVSPSSLSPRNHPAEAKVRRNEILRRMEQDGYIDEKKYEIFSALPLRVAEKSRMPIAPHALEYIKKDLVKKGVPKSLPWKGNLEVRTTLDRNLQYHAEKAVEEAIKEYERRNGVAIYNPLEACLMVVEHATGQIVAYVGGRDFLHNKFDHCSQSRRQPGSTFKTFVLAAALEEKRALPWTLDSPVEDSLRCYGPRRHPYCPQNYPGLKPLYAGTIPLLRAFAESRNAAFVWLGNKIGIGDIIATAQRFGFSIPERNMSVILGSAEVTPWELTKAFTVFPNNGAMVEPFMVYEVLGEEGLIFSKESRVPRAILSEQAAGSLREALRRTVTHGTARRAYLAIPLSGKTGTTSRQNVDGGRDETIDAWFCGFSTQYTACVWMGLDTPENIGAKETGARTALPVFIKFMQRAHAYELKELEETAKEAPEGPFWDIESDELFPQEPQKPD